MSDSTFDIFWRTLAASAWCGSYGLRLVGVGLLSLLLCLNVVRLLSVIFISWSEYVNAVTEKLIYKTKLGHIKLYKLQKYFFPHVLKLTELYSLKA